MGDFQLSSEQLLERFGVTTVTPQTNELTELHQSVREEEIQAEIESDLLLGVDCPAPSDLRYRESICTDLTLRKWIEKHQLHAFTINFRDLEELRTMPFMEICKAMARGIGYAGEGDCLTAVFTGALLTAYEQTSFVEIFCPDWKHNTLLISHMGEMNFRCAKGKIEFFEKEFVFGNAPNPIAGTACFQSGEAIFVNIFQDASGFHMLYSPVSVIEEETDHFRHNIRGWIRPEGTIASFLENISKYGGTHHSILVYHATCEEMEFFADCLNINPIRIA